MSLSPLLQVHYHGKPISVNVSINNSTNKLIKKIKISGELLFLFPLYLVPNLQVIFQISAPLTQSAFIYTFPLMQAYQNAYLCPQAHLSASCTVYPCIRSHLRAVSWGLEDDCLIIVMCFSWLFSGPDHRCCPVFLRQVHQDRVHSGVHVSWHRGRGQRAKGWVGGKRVGDWRQRRGLGKEGRG